MATEISFAFQVSDSLLSLSLLTLVLTWYTMWLLVKSPTLCGSPTTISKVGLAASSILTLGCDCLLAPSASTGGCTGGGPLNPAPSSSRLTESIIPGRLDACDLDDVGRTLRAAADSFRGGSGASSLNRGLLSAAPPPPSGPSGSTSSPTASNFVACAFTLRVPRGPRRAGEGAVCWAGCSVPVWTMRLLVT